MQRPLKKLEWNLELLKKPLEDCGFLSESLEELTRLVRALVRRSDKFGLAFSRFVQWHLQSFLSKVRRKLLRKPFKTFSNLNLHEAVSKICSFPKLLVRIPLKSYLEHDFCSISKKLRQHMSKWHVKELFCIIATFFLNTLLKRCLEYNFEPESRATC